MLVLSRKAGDAIDIYTRDGVITVNVNKISGNRATIGIDAPRIARILRGEMELTEHERAELLAQFQTPPAPEPSAAA